ncbi:hypothetical protein F5Y04DRAFT_287602 [Hypomontagnella monticulosa]|nr:hypothetical protein F5Y04DRAFT_287602 [Hypomontagnella monticulosa]
MYKLTEGNIRTIDLLASLEKLQQSIEKLKDISDSDPEEYKLLELIKDLVTTTRSIDNLATKERRHSLASDLIYLQSVYTSTFEVTQECIALVDPLGSAIERIISIHERDKIDKSFYPTTETQLTSAAWYGDTYKSLEIYVEVLRMLEASITLLRCKDQTSENGSLSAKAVDAASTLQYGISLVESKLHGTRRPDEAYLQKALRGAKEIALQVPASLNKHFMVGRSVKTFYTGREKQMERLVAAFRSNAYIGQKRFVIYGLSGSGKTELAMKYAEDHLQEFWGVFFIDASSFDNALGSYREIAKIGGVELNHRAAKNWLTTLAAPWLLIIDNADDDDEALLDKILPAGMRGCILITTRNPARKSYGTVGDKYLELLSMDEEEASDLILRAAEEPSPWTEHLKQSAGKICEALGFLPLALIHAGKAIFLGLCSWSGYLAYYERQSHRIRERNSQRDRSSSRSKNMEESENMNVFSSYEILYQYLESSQEEKCQDAVELLQLFSYFHHQNIRVDMLINAATNPLKMEIARADEAKEEEEIRRRFPYPMKRSWSTWLREILIRMSRLLDSPPPLPAALKHLGSGNGATLEDVSNSASDRVRLALVVLVQRSLVMTLNRTEGRYCMHPLVHKWLRDRSSTSQQALWCQVSTTVLANNILLPPLGDTESEQSMQRELLPHIIHARKLQEIIETKLERNRSKRRSVWPPIYMGFGKYQAMDLARFSQVYLGCGYLDEALKLQRDVRAFAIQKVGEEHPLAILITLALTLTLYELSEASEATRLQQRIYDICLESFGPYHPLTLRVAAALASSLCFMGQWSASLSLHNRAVESLAKVYGEEDVKTLKAVRSLANVHLRYLEFEKACELHLKTWEEMKKQLGETHKETLVCLEELAMSRLRLGENYFQDCHDKMSYVLDQRKEAAGREHPHTLLAICNIGRVKSAMGQHTEAAQIMEEAVVIAERNLGENHFGVLSGKTHYAQVLVNQKRYEEAEEIFKTIINKPQYEKSTDDIGGEHPDRLIALWYLTGCLERQGKLQEALDICEGMMVSLREIGGQGLGTKHEFAIRVENEVTKIKELMNDEKQALDPNLVVPSEI